MTDKMTAAISALTIGSRYGYGQVEANHLSMQRTGQIYAQLPADSSITLLENGQFVKYDVANGKVNFTGTGEWMMVFNEVKLYGDTYNETYKDYAMKAENFTDSEMTPRVVKLNIGDLYTTNCLGGAGSYRTTYTGTAVKVGDTLIPDESTGYLISGTGDYELTVVKIYTMADGQPAVKLMRTK